MVKYTKQYFPYMTIFEEPYNLRFLGGPPLAKDGYFKTKKL